MILETQSERKCLFCGPHKPNPLLLNNAESRLGLMLSKTPQETHTHTQTAQSLTRKRSMFFLFFRMGLQNCMYGSGLFASPDKVHFGLTFFAIFGWTFLLFSFNFYQIWVKFLQHTFRLDERKLQRYKKKKR